MRIRMRKSGIVDRYHQSITIGLFFCRRFSFYHRRRRIHIHHAERAAFNIVGES